MRVTLGRLRPEDAPQIAGVLNDWDMARWLTALPWPYGLPEAEAFIDSTGPDELAIRAGDRLAGVIRLTENLGYWVAPGFQGRGIALRAAVLGLTRWFAAGHDGIDARHLVGNHRSARLLARLGFRETGEGESWSVPEGRMMPTVTLHLSRADFAARHGISLTTARLVIDAFRPADLEPLHRITTQPDVARMLLRFRPGMSLDEMATIFDDQALLPPMRLTVRHRDRVAGSIGISAGDPPRIFYWLDPTLAGQGLGQDMVGAFLDEIQDRFDPPQLLADVFLDNMASRRLLKNLGFQRVEDGMLKSCGRDEAAPAALYRWDWRSRL